MLLTNSISFSEKRYTISKIIKVMVSLRTEIFFGGLFHYWELGCWKDTLIYSLKPVYLPGCPLWRAFLGMMYPFIPGLAFARTVQVASGRSAHWPLNPTTLPFYLFVTLLYTCPVLLNCTVYILIVTFIYQ